MAGELDKAKAGLLLLAAGAIVYMVWRVSKGLDALPQAVRDLANKATEAPPGDLPVTAPDRLLPENPDDNSLTAEYGTSVGLGSVRYRNDPSVSPYYAGQLPDLVDPPEGSPSP